MRDWLYLLLGIAIFAAMLLLTIWVERLERWR